MWDECQNIVCGKEKATRDQTKCTGEKLGSGYRGLLGCMSFIPQDFWKMRLEIWNLSP